MATLTIDLDPEAWRNDAYALRDSNVLSAGVSSATGEPSTKIVLLSLSRDAMIGLGTSLLRWAHSDEMAKPMSVAELLPVSRGFVQSNLGVYLHPDSLKLVVTHAEFGTVDGLLDRKTR